MSHLDAMNITFHCYCTCQIIWVYNQNMFQKCNFKNHKKNKWIKDELRKKLKNNKIGIEIEQKKIA